MSLTLFTYLNSFSYIRISVHKQAGRGLDGYEFVTENFLRNRANAANCQFNLSCTGNANVNCEFVNSHPFNTTVYQWIILTGGGGSGNVYNTLMATNWKQVSTGVSSGNIMPTGMSITSDGVNNESVFVRYNDDVTASNRMEALTVYVYSLSEAIALGLTN